MKKAYISPATGLLQVGACGLLCTSQFEFDPTKSGNMEDAETSAFGWSANDWTEDDGE